MIQLFYTAIACFPIYSYYTINSFCYNYLDNINITASIYCSNTTDPLYYPDQLVSYMLIYDKHIIILVLTIIGIIM